MKTIACRGYRLVGTNDIQEKVLERNEHVKDLVAEKREEHEAGRNHGIHEVVVGRRNNGDQNEGRVSKTNEKIEKFPESVLACLTPF